MIFFFSKREKFTSPANEFLLHKCRNKNRKRNYFSKLKKFLQVQLMNFYYIKVETIGKWITFFFFQIWKNLQVQLMSFYYISIETIGKWKKWFIFSNLKKCTSPANEFLLHECKNKNYIFFFKSEKSYKSS